MNNTKEHTLKQRGILHKVYEEEQKTEKFKIREFVLKIPSPHYEQLPKFQLTNDRCDLIDPYDVGEEIIVYFDIHGREWNGNFYTNLSAWRILSAAVVEGQQKPPTTKAAAPTVATIPEQEEEEDDLPF
jgi:single-strand DNA-binding protein